MSDSDSIVDLLVFGGGMAGMSAAARACSDGASVVLVEKGPAIGGSAVYAGFIWTAPTVEVMRDVNPDADPALSARVVEQYGDALDWVRSLDVAVADPVTVLGYGRGSATDMANYLLTCDRLLSRATGSSVSTARSWWAPQRRVSWSRTEPSSARRSRTAPASNG